MPTPLGNAPSIPTTTQYLSVLEQYQDLLQHVLNVILLIT
jgi:hypothetical protein